MDPIKYIYIEIDERSNFALGAYPQNTVKDSGIK